MMTPGNSSGISLPPAFVPTPPRDDQEIGAYYRQLLDELVAHYNRWVAGV